MTYPTKKLFPLVAMTTGVYRESSIHQSKRSLNVDCLNMKGGGV